MCPSRARRHNLSRDGRKRKLFRVAQLPEHRVYRDIDDAQGRGGGMPEIQKLVAIGEVKQPRADSVEADLRASGQEISTDAGR
jgi:hypothetical protein